MTIRDRKRFKMHVSVLKASNIVIGVTCLSDSLLVTSILCLVSLSNRQTCRETSGYYGRWKDNPTNEIILETSFIHSVAIYGSQIFFWQKWHSCSYLKYRNQIWSIQFTFSYILFHLCSRKVKGLERGKA